MYDKVKNLQTLGNQGSKFAYQDYQNILFEGKVNVRTEVFLARSLFPRTLIISMAKEKYLSMLKQLMQPLTHQVRLR